MYFPELDQFNHVYAGRNNKNWLVAVGNIDSESSGELPGQWSFGHITYDYKNEIESLSSDNPASFQCSNFNFFVPEVVALVKTNEVQILHSTNQAIEDQLTGVLGKSILSQSTERYVRNIIDLTTKEDYLKNVRSLLRHIQHGDIYEINYCIGFRSHGSIDPYATFHKLWEITEAPFACLYKRRDLFVLCASPERFIRKTGSQLLSQPIKGTAARSSHIAIDDQLKEELRTNMKERAENIMIVDIVRNDLSRIAQRGSVHVPELCEVYSYKTVHQMISTVVCELQPNVALKDIIHATFPMGSMTGAPKIRAMELADEHENFSRGIYSGTIGYVKPNGNFDFNVVIRTIVYDRKEQLAELYAGSAITAHCDPETEYEECLLKAQSMIRALN